MKIYNNILIYYLVFLPHFLSSHKFDIFIDTQPAIDISEHVRLKLNNILEIPEGRNYWEKEFKTKPYEDKLKLYYEQHYK
jgi:hypothetical protein